MGASPLSHPTARFVFALSCSHFQYHSICALFQEYFMMHTCGRICIMSVPTFIDGFNHHHILLSSQPCGIDWGDRKTWGALSKTWNLNGSPRRALWEQCDSDFVCSTPTTPPSTVATKPYNIIIRPIQHNPISFHTISLRPFKQEEYPLNERSPDRFERSRPKPLRFSDEIHPRAQ